jgi:hypothetical protein
LCGAQLRRLRALPLDEQLDVCVRALRATPTRAPAALEAVCLTLGDAPTRSARDWQRARPDELSLLEDPIKMAWWSVVLAFARDERLGDEKRREDVASCLVHVLEAVADLGVDATAF